MDVRNNVVKRGVMDKINAILGTSLLIDIIKAKNF